MSTVCVLWDDSHIWGLLLIRALRSWNLPVRLLRASEIAQAGLSRKSCAALLVPGGPARAKAERLGRDGLAAIRDFVEDGGAYLGFCGGAGLALEDGGLELCPWSRLAFTDRMQHFLSGHVGVALNQDSDLTPAGLGGSILAPVWWPAQFDEDGGGVEVLARYQEPGPDFWIADLCLRELPAGTARAWKDLYGIDVSPKFLRGRPCVVAGEYGKGRYALSYSHLETPASDQANAWLAHLLSTLAGIPARPKPKVPAWQITDRPTLWDDPALMRARAALDQIIEVGINNFLLFWRNCWLLGWRRGIPGSAINALYALVREIAANEPTEAAADYWAKHSEDFAANMEVFAQGTTSLLLAERLAMTVFHSDPDAVSAKGLRKQRSTLFGPPPGSGGLFAGMLATLEELAWLQLADSSRTAR